MKISRKIHSKEMGEAMEALCALMPHERDSALLMICNMKRMKNFIPKADIALSIESDAVKDLIKAHSKKFFKAKTVPYRILLGSWEWHAMDGAAAIMLNNKLVDIELVDSHANYISAVSSDEYSILEGLYGDIFKCMSFEEEEGLRG